MKITIFVEASDLNVLSFAIWIECRVEFANFSFDRACHVMANNWIGQTKNRKKNNKFCWSIKLLSGEKTYEIGIAERNAFFPFSNECFRDIFVSLVEQSDSRVWIYKIVDVSKPWKLHVLQEFSGNS